ncbi:MAG: ATP-binding protein, partial [Limnothrix sp.]
ARQSLERFGEATNVELVRTLSRSTPQEISNFITTASTLPNDELANHPSTKQFRRYIDQSTADLDITKIKIFEPSGRTVFSTDPQQIGEDKSNYTGFQAAIQDQIFSSLENHDPFLILRSRNNDQRTLYSSYIPIYNNELSSIETNQKEPIGVIEIYRDVTSMAQSTIRSERWIFASIFISFLLLYAALLIIVNRANTVLTAKKEELEDRNKQIQQQTNELQSTLHQLQTTQTQLIQQEKMSGLGRMVAGISHELNNPITFVQGNIEHTYTSMQDLLGLLHLYQQEYPNPSVEIQSKNEDIDLDFVAVDLPRCLQSMKTGTARIKDIVLALRIFSRLDEAGIKLIDLNQSFANVWSLLNYRLLAFDICVIEKMETLPMIECDAAGINQVLFHIISNAIDALETSNVADKQITIYTEQFDENSIWIRIKNNGKKIDKETIDYIFDPFFTTKSVGQGTGMGLTLAYQIVSKHHGDLSVASTDEFTEFTIKLPIKIRRAAQSQFASA